MRREFLIPGARYACLHRAAVLPRPSLHSRSPLSPLAPPRELSPGVLVGDVADRCRAALVAFLRLDREGVDRPALATWLFGPYLDALTLGRASAVATEPSLVVGDANANASANANANANADAATVITNAARAIERVLRAFHDDVDPSIAARLVERGVIEHVCDDHGGSGFAPLGRPPGMPLAARVLGVLAVEMLTRPDRLRADLVVTETSVELADRTIASGVAMRSRQTLPWTPARDENKRAPGWPASNRAPTLAELVAAQDECDDDEWPA